MAFPSVYEMTNIARSATLDENYSSGWTSTDSQVTVSSNQVNFSSALCGTDRRVYKPLGFTLDDRFVVEWEFSLTDSGSSQAQPFALTAGTAQLDNGTTNQDSIYFKSSSSGYQLACKDGQSNSQDSTAHSYTNGTTLYARLVRSGTSGTLSVYSDSTRNTLVNSSTHTIPASVTGLNTLQHGVDAVQGGTRTISGTISNVNIWNGVDNKTARRQHFWEYFSGATLNSRWTFNDLSGTGGLVRIQDVVNEGIYLQSGTSSSADRAGINFNNKRLFSHDSSVSIVMGKESGGSIAYFGLGNIIDPNQSSPTNISVHRLQNNGYYFQLKTADNTSASTQDSTVSPNSGFHVFKIINGSSNISSSIDGIVQTTKTSNRPTLAMQPILAVEGQGGNCKIRYMECYNT